MADKIDTDAIKSNSNIVDVIGRHVPLDKRGSEFYGTCPFHDDKKASLQVNETKQVFKCFACGEGGDSIEFLLKSGVEFHDALKEIKGGDLNETNPIQNVVPKKVNKPTWEYVPNPSVDPESFKHYKHGEPSMKWEYKNEHGNTVGFVCRFDLDNGEKEVLPYSFATNGTIEQWRWMGIPSPRPLYNLDLIHKHPNASILIVEGEKTADAGSEQLDVEKTIVTTWIGGANGIKNTDFSVLNGRKCIFFADNDQPGFKAMNEIAQMIETDVKRFVSIPEHYPAKWDIADESWDDIKVLRQFILDRITKTEYKLDLKDKSVKKLQEPDLKPNPAPLTVVQSPKNPPLPPMVVPTESFSENEHFRMLGYDKDENSRLVYYFFSFDAKSVIKLSPPSMNKSNLMMLAPINWWEDTFPKKTSIDIDAAQQFLMGRSHQIGPFRDKYIRGRGAWMEDEKLVIHTGETLLIDKQLIPLRSFHSRFVYEIGETLGFGNDKPLKNAESIELIKKMQWLGWDRDISAYLLAGWCVIAPFCGVLKWRPHVWVTGAAGTGKSYVMDNMIKRLMGEVAIVVQGKTTEAGVRGILQSDARPVLFDESDVDSYNDKERIQSILALARSSSYSDGGVISKGTQNGSARSYMIRSCFAFSSIGVQLNQQSDRSRFTMLSLKSFDGVRTKEEFAEFERGWNELVTEDFVHSLQSRTMELLPTIMENSKTFSDAASSLIGNRRIGDQVGGMLAGAYSLTSSNVISYDDAYKWIEQRDWTEERGMEATKDENQLFSLLMAHMIRIEGTHSTVERSIGELILCAADDLADIGVTRENANTRLRRIGMMVTDNQIHISNTAPGIKEIIKNTSWSSNHGKVLERLDGAEKLAPRTFYPGLKSRGVSLPLGMISDGFTFERFTNPEAMNDYKAKEMEFDDKDDDGVPF